MTSTRRWWVVLPVVLLLGGMSAPSAWASHAKDGYAGDPDNADHRMDRIDLTAKGWEAAVHGAEQLNRSDMNATFSGSGDVEIEDGNYGVANWAGETACISGVNWATGNCDVFRVRFHTGNLADYGLKRWRSVGCHEFGHTAGLGHRNSSNDAEGTTPSCMRNDLDLWPTTFDLHDLDAINDSV